MTAASKTNLSKLRDKIQTGMGKFQRNKYVSAIAGGMMAILPVLMVGSFASIFFSLNIGPYQAFITQSGLKNIFNIITAVTTDILSIYVVISLSNSLAAELKVDKFMSIISSLVAFLLVTPMLVQKGKFIGLDMNYIGSQGMLVAMVVALTATRLFALFANNKHLVIKMPDSVPEFVSKTFASMLPIFLITIIYAIVNFLFALTPYHNIDDMIIKIIKIPLQGLC